MTSAERFEAWFSEYLTTANGFGWIASDLEAAWQAAERQALERAALHFDAMPATTTYAKYEAADAIRALIEDASK